MNMRSKKVWTPLFLIGVLVLLEWWWSAPRQVQIPREVTLAMPACSMIEGFESKSIYTMEEMDRRQEITAQCHKEQEEYMSVHGRGITFFTLPYVLQKWLD